MRHLYTLFLWLAMPLLLLRLLIKSRKFPAYRHRINERFARSNTLRKVDIWVHAVSLGEAIAISPLIDALLDNHFQLMVTTTTPTGSKHILKQFQNRVQHHYLPYDLPSIQRRFLNAIQPKQILLMETEIWPNLIMEAKKQGVKVAIMNARLSQQSLRGYKKIASLITPVLQSVDVVLAQSDDDANRFRHFVSAQGNPCVHVFGNIKFDHPQPTLSKHSMIFDLKKQWGQERPVLILASTHDDEEKQLLTQLKHSAKAIQDLLILVVPRHPERFNQVTELASSLGFVTYKRSEPDTIQPDAEVVIVDSIGELTQWYATATVAFVGGSMVPVGGHNVLEPVSAGIPVVTGPFLQNFVQIANLLKKKNALVVANDSVELCQSIIDLLLDPQRCEQIALSATAVLEDNQGALQRYVNWVLDGMNVNVERGAKIG